MHVRLSRSLFHFHAASTLTSEDLQYFSVNGPSTVSLIDDAISSINLSASFSPLYKIRLEGSKTSAVYYTTESSLTLLCMLQTKWPLR